MTRADRTIRWAAAVAVVIVSGIATVISYAHAHELVLQHGESGRTAAALPLTVDGLIATCSLVLLDCARSGRRTPWHAWVLLSAGVLATLGANIAHGLTHGWVGGIIAGWPALVAVGSFELLIRLVRDGKTGVVTAPVEDVEASKEPLLQIESLPGDEAVEEHESGVPEVLVQTARDRFAEVLAAGTVPSIRAIRKDLRVGHPRAVAIRSALADQ